MSRRCARKTARDASRSIRVRCRSRGSGEVVAGPVAGAWRGGQGSTGFAPWSKRAKRSTSRRPRIARRRCGAIFGDAVGLVHGGMNGPDEDSGDGGGFQSGEDKKILVATTVVEVGVDVPEATIMIVGSTPSDSALLNCTSCASRVGRGRGALSSCLLLYKGPLGEPARAQLEILRETEDGFPHRGRGSAPAGRGRRARRTPGRRAPGFRFARLGVHGGLVARAPGRMRAPRVEAHQRKTGRRGEQGP